MLFQGSYHCLEWSAPSLYTPCAQHGAVNCSQTRPEMSGLFPSCAAPAASFSKMWCVKSNPLGYRFQFILLTIKSKVNVEVIICWLRRLTFFTSLFFTHSINLSSRYDRKKINQTRVSGDSDAFTVNRSATCALELHWCWDPEGIKEKADGSGTLKITWGETGCLN